MTQAVSTGLGLMINLAMFAGTSQLLISSAKNNSHKITTLWHTEYGAHVCGRALSAMYNIHGAATLAAAHRPSKKRMNAATEEYFRQRIFAKYEHQFEMIQTQCFDRASHTLIAEVYLRNSDASHVNDPNYGYRIVRKNNGHSEEVTIKWN